MRRMFGRPFRQGFGPDIPPMLQRANQLMAAQDYAGAATAFEQLAKAAEGRGGPRAPFFYLQAGRARIFAGQIPAGMDHLQYGLNLFARRGQLGKVFNAGNRIVGELNQRGLTHEAGQIAEHMKSLLPAFNAMSESVHSRKAALPTHCPGCGAPVRPDEVDWLDDVTAECAFCGSPVRGEN